MAHATSTATSANSQSSSHPVIQSSSHSSVTVDLNGDGRPDRCETISRSHNGIQSGRTTCYVTTADGTSQKVFELPYPIYSITFPGTRTNGWADLTTQKDATSVLYTWHWNGRTYR